MEKPFLITDKVVVFKAKLKEFKAFLVRAAITEVIKEGLSNCFQAVLVVIPLRFFTKWNLRIGSVRPCVRPSVRPCVRPSPVRSQKLLNGFP